MENYTGRNCHSWTQSSAVRPVSSSPHLFLCSLTPRALSLAWRASPWPECPAGSVLGQEGQLGLLWRQGPSLPPGGVFISRWKCPWCPAPPPSCSPGDRACMRMVGGLFKLSAEGVAMKEPEEQG